MIFNSINTSIAPSFIALPSSEGFLSDDALDQILNQPYEGANSEVTTFPSIADSSMTDDPQDFGPPPKLPLLPQFAHTESPKTQETKKRKKEDKALPAEVSDDPTTKKQKPETTKLSDRTIEPTENSNDRLIKATTSVILDRISKKTIAKRYNVPEDSLSYYVSTARQALKSSIKNEKICEHTSSEIVDAVVARCQERFKENPSLKAKIENPIRVAPTNLSDRNINPKKNFDKRLINAIPHVVIYGQKPSKIAKQYKIPPSTFAYYIEDTNKSLKPYPQNGGKTGHTRAEVVDAAVAQCLKLLKENPSLKTNEERETEQKTLRVDALLQAMNHNNPDDVTNDKLKKLEWGRECFNRYVRAAQRCALSNTFPPNCISYVKEAAIKYRELNKS